MTRKLSKAISNATRNAIVPAMMLVAADEILLEHRAEALTAASADDICTPVTNPCVISQGYDVTGLLDFGSRTVQIVSGGRLRGQPGITLTCGALEITTGLTAEAVIDVDGSAHGNLNITATRACSGDGVTPCLDNSVCAAATLGTCSAGNTGTIAGDGKIAGTGGNPGNANLKAAGNLSLGRTVNFSCTAAGYDGGAIDVQSYMGSVTVTGQLLAKSGAGTYYEYGGIGGDIDVRAAVDVDISGSLDVWGTDGAGSVLVDAGRDLIVTSGIAGSGGGGLNATGGYVSLTAGADIIVTQVPGGDAVQEIQTDGGTSFYFYGYGGAGSWYSGYGGYQYFEAGDDISLGPSAKVHSNGGWAAKGGNIYFDADGTLIVEGEIRAIGPPPFQGLDSGAAGGHIYITTGDGMTLMQGALIKTASPFGGSVNIEVDGLLTVNGEIDVRGNGGENFGYNPSQSGDFYLEGAADVVVGGKIRAGGPSRHGVFTLDVCRLTLTGEINDRHGSPNPQNNDTFITVRESMTAAQGSKLLSDPAGAQTFIVYRDPAKPPVLDGTVDPPPVLSVNPSLVGCPVCGNLEIDQGESCDDGNTTSGDGCRNDCQDEGCIADTPGFPSTALCDDGNACTLNQCHPVAHACENPVSCEEGVGCTVDACTAGACTHVPDDSLCNDHNDCTDDLCNATTGCVHADLTGGPCNDSDFCTPAGTCDDGDCATSALRLANDNRIKTKVNGGIADDILKATMYMPLSLADADPTATGMTVVLANAFGDVISQTDLASSGWVDKNGSGLQFAYNDGVRAAKIKRNVDADVARVNLKIKNADLADSSGEDVLSLSVLLGTAASSDDCVTALKVPCTANGANLSCRE